jgi:hypothetical protein
MRRHALSRCLYSLPFRPFAPRATLAGLCVAALFSACDSHDAPSASVLTSNTTVASPTNPSTRLDASSLPLLSAAPGGIGHLAATIVPPGNLAAGLNSSLATLGNTANGNSATPEDPVQNALASLAADSHQVKPVIRYAPGDGPGDSSGIAQSNN